MALMEYAFVNLVLGDKDDHDPKAGPKASLLMVKVWSWVGLAFLMADFNPEYETC